MKTFRILAFLFAAALAGGCATQLDPSGVYRGDQTLYSADMAIANSFAVFDAFLRYEHANRANVSPEATEFADRLRRESPKWFKRAVALRDAYALAPSAETRSGLQTSLAVLREAITQTTLYLAERNATSSVSP
jgi:hypothetical protein